MSEAVDSLIKSTETAMATDAKGRVITVKRLNALQYYRLTKALGGAAANPASMEMATLACCVVRIDVTDIAPPQNERDVEFIIQQLDFDGIAAAGEALQQLTDPAVEREAAKN